MIDQIAACTADGAASLLAWILRPWGRNTYRDLVNALWERQPVWSKYDIQLVVNDHVSPDVTERPLVERIFAAYRKAKLDQAQKDPMFLPGGGWKNVTNSAFSYLIEGFENNDLDRFHYFLANFGAWGRPTGIGESWIFSKLKASKRKQTHFEQNTMRQLFQWWESCESRGRSLSELSMPGFGNHGGAIVNGHMILPFSVYSDFYARMLARFVNSDTAVIGELGGGFGRLCYFLKRQLPQSTYVEFDLPESLCCAMYYLMKSFPDKKFLLYGEEELTAECWVNYDFVFLPSFEITKIPSRSFDLFINENSLGMVPPETCKLFVQEICRVSNAIWHRNHETRRLPFEDGSQSLLNYEYPFDPKQFVEVVRYCDIARLIRNDQAATWNDMYWYYYRRKDG